MTRRRTRFQSAVAASCLAILAISLTPAAAQQAPSPAPPPTATSSAELDALFARLAAPEGDGWRAAESDILRAWSRSGSAVVDLLAQRGEEALDRGEVEEAFGHLTAVTDHAPDWATGWQLRAAALASEGAFGPAAADLARALALEPRQFVALTQLGAMLDEMGDAPRAIAAFEASLAIHPHQPEASDALARLRAERDGTAA